MKLGPYGASALFFLAENDDSNLGRVFAVLDRERPEEQIDTDVELYDKM